MQNSSGVSTERRISSQTRYSFAHFDELSSDEDQRGSVSAPEPELHVESRCPGRRAVGPSTDSESEIIAPSANTPVQRRRFSKKERLRRRRQALQAASQAQDEGLEMVDPAREMRRPHFASGTSGRTKFQRNQNLSSGDLPSANDSSLHLRSLSSGDVPSATTFSFKASSTYPDQVCPDAEWYNMSTPDTGSEQFLHESLQSEAEPAGAPLTQSPTSLGFSPDDCTSDQILPEPGQCQDEQSNKSLPLQCPVPTSSTLFASAAAVLATGYYLYRRRCQQSNPQIDRPARKLDTEVKPKVASEAETTADFANICAVGSTGSGKSCLLNFLLDPCEEHCFSPEEQTCKTGETTRSCTLECKVVTKGSLKVVDTPGTNESHGADLVHMINVAKALRQVGKLNLVLLAMSYQKRLDQQWKDTVLYYRDLIGHQAFCSNVAIVLTGYDLGKPQKRKYMGDHHEEILAETRNAVKDLLNLESPPLVFAIDCLPEEEEHRELHEKTRLDILKYATQQQAIDVSNICVQKTKELRRIDDQKIRVLEGQMDQLKIRFDKASTLPHEIKQQVKRCTEQTAAKKVELANLAAEISEYDSEALVLAREHLVNKPYSSVQSQKETVYIEAPCVHRKVQWWCDVLLELHVSHVTSRAVQVAVRKRASLFQYFRKHRARQGFAYEVKLWAYKMDLYAQKLTSLKESRRDLERDLQALHSERLALILRSPEATHASNELQVEMNKKLHDINELHWDSMTIEEAMMRLPEVQRSKL